MIKNKKSLGQNWLQDRPTLEQIANLAATTPMEISTCVEIGPGLGTLTSSLLRHFEKVIAIELDANLAKNLPKSFPKKNLEVINEDILSFDFSKVTQPFVIAGNIPYYITTPIIKKLLTLSVLPTRIVLLIQKEVAEKICPKAGTSSSSLSLFIENFAEVSLGPIVSKNFFTPIPKVDSQIIVLDPRTSHIASDSDLIFIKQCFSFPRKTLLKNLTSALLLDKTTCLTALHELSLPQNSRPGNLTLTNYVMLAQKLKKM